MNEVICYQLELVTDNLSLQSVADQNSDSTYVVVKKEDVENQTNVYSSERFQESNWFTAPSIKGLVTIAVMVKTGNDIPYFSTMP